MAPEAQRFKWTWPVVGLLIFGAIFLASCAAATVSPPIEHTQATKPELKTPTVRPPSPTQQTTPPSQIETRQVELEWPSTLHLGESDIVRLALIPSSKGYIAQAEFPEHLVESNELPIEQISGYDLTAVARLDAVGFNVSPQGDMPSYLPPGEAIAWHWTLTPRELGRQRLAISLVLHWIPTSVSNGLERETLVFSRGMDVQVTSFLGLTRSQAAVAGVIGLILGGSLSLAAVVQLQQPSRKKLAPFRPNPALAVETQQGIQLSGDDRSILRALFNHYARLVIESEFLSGYSGARTYLALPIRPDGRSDAHTIVKIGEPESIRREYENYETYVKDTLPPITARIQHAPVEGPGRKQAALRYTFISEPGNPPVSLRKVLLENPDPGYLQKLFDTFGPSWWMQRRPYTFRLAQEYDRMLPAHYVIRPQAGKGKTLDGKASPVDYEPVVGELVTLRNFETIERRADGNSLSLMGQRRDGQPALRIRWLGLNHPNGASGQVISTRQSLLEGFVHGFDRLNLPDPLSCYPELLAETVPGTQATIHGDLNLENILVGPGGMIWLVDFAQTRDGHPLFDFAHLEAELIAHIVAARNPTPEEYIDFLAGNPTPALSPVKELLDKLHAIAQRCLFNPSQPREYNLALCMACLGALKFKNLDKASRQLLYLTAAYLCKELGS